jgi:hypothetical protein
MVGDIHAAHVREFRDSHLRDGESIPPGQGVTQAVTRLPENEIEGVALARNRPCPARTSLIGPARTRSVPANREKPQAKSAQLQRRAHRAQSHCNQVTDQTK